MKTKSKILVLILTLALLCGAVALIASAETTGTVVSTPEELTAAWTATSTNGGTITLKNDIEYPNTLEMPEKGNTMTLDLGGHKLTYTGTADRFMDVEKWSNRTYTLTVKNGTISVGGKVTAIRVSNGGSSEIKNANFENLTVTNTATDTEFPTHLVELNKTTVKMNGVCLSGKAKDIFSIGSGTTLTAVNTTVSNAIIPKDDGTIERAAIQVYGNNTVTMTNCLVESVYTGIRFDKGEDATKNTFLFKNSTLNVTFRKDLTGTDLSTLNSPFNDASGNPKKYNVGFVNKIYFTAPATMTLDGSKVIGTGYGRLAANEGNITNIKSLDSRIVYRNSFLHGGNWGRNCYVTLEGTNFFFWTSAPAYNASTYVKAMEGSRSYFAGTMKIDAAIGSDGKYPDGYAFPTDNNEYPTPTYIELNPTFRITSDCMNQETRSVDIKSVLIPKDDTLTASGVLADLDRLETHTDLGAKIYNASGKLAALTFGNTLVSSFPNGGTIRLTRDLTIPSPEKTLMTFKNKVYFDLNGYWFSIGGTSAKYKPELFNLQSDLFVYTSRQGGGIRFLAIGEGEDSDKSYVNMDATAKGTNSLFGLNSPTAHLHLGYTDNAGETDYRDNGFTMISSVMAQYYNGGGGRVTIKGGNYYRSFSDNTAFFDIRTLSENNANLLTAEDAYFYGNAPIISGHLTTEEKICDGVTASFKNCKIDAPVIAAQSGNKFENSAVTLTNCDILRNQAAVAGVDLAFGEGCRYPSTVSILQVATGVKGDVMINDAVMTYRGARRITLAQATAGESSFTGEATITLNRKVTANYATLTFVSGTESETELWEKGATPTQIEDTIIDDNYYVTYGTIGTVTEDATYTARVISKESRIKGNLTLYANITFNLYLKDDGIIKGVRYNGKETLFTAADRVQVDEVDYFLFRINDIAPKDLSKAFRLDVIVNGTPAHYTVMTSLVKYADSVLQNVSESEAGKTLVMALLDYVRETSVALGDVSTESMGIKAIDACLAKYGYTRTEWTKPETVIEPAAGDIKGAALELLNTPGFVFFLNDTYADKNSVTVTVNGVTKGYEVRHIDVNGTAKHCFTVDNIHISNYRKDLTVKLGEQSFTYNFDVYMTGFKTAVPAYAHALYAYSVAAEAYLAAQNNH